MCTEDFDIHHNWGMYVEHSSILSIQEMNAENLCMNCTLGMCIEDFDIHHNWEMYVEGSGIQSIQEMHAWSQCM